MRGLLALEYGLDVLPQLDDRCIAIAWIGLQGLAPDAVDGAPERMLLGRVLLQREVTIEIFGADEWPNDLGLFPWVLANRERTVTQGQLHEQDPEGKHLGGFGGWGAA
jgi:hypothetical protein